MFRNLNNNSLQIDGEQAIVLDRELVRYGNNEIKRTFSYDTSRLYMRLTIRLLKNDMKKFDKMFVYCPIYYKVSIPLANYFEIQYKLENNIGSKKQIESYKRILSLKDLEYVCKGNSMTNFLEINLVTFIISDIETMEFMYKFNEETKFFVDSYISKSQALDFCLSNKLNLGKLINFKSFYEKSRSNGLTTCKTCNVLQSYDVNFLLIKLPTNVDVDFKVKRKYIDDLYVDFVCNDGLVSGISLSTATFDIECGYSSKTTEVKSIPIASNSFVQCICIVDEDFEGVYKVNSKRCYAYVNKRSFNQEKIQDLVSQNNYKITWKLFTDEVNLINTAITHLYKKDIIFSYNGQRFDLPFLILRYNYLKGKIFEENFSFNSICPINDTRMKISSKNPSNKYYSCKYCSSEEKIDTRLQNNNSIVSLECKKCNKPNDVNRSKIFTKEVGSISKYIREFPFSFHKDLYTVDIMKKGCENWKLETLLNIHLKMKIQKITTSIDSSQSSASSNNVLIYLQDDLQIGNIQNILEVFCFNIKLVLFNIESYSGQQYNKQNCILKKLFFIDKEQNLENLDFNNTSSWTHFDKTKWWQFYLDNYAFYFNGSGEKLNTGSGSFKCVFFATLEEEFNSDKIFKSSYVSIGKTSTQTLLQQLNWTSENDLVETVLYCMFDSLLTLSLEKSFYTIVNFISMSEEQLTLFESLSKDPPEKASIVYLSYLDKHKVIKQKPESFQSLKSLIFAMKVEWPEIGESVEHFEDDDYIAEKLTKVCSIDENIVKLEASNKLGEIFDLDRDNIVNEYRMGIDGEWPPDDLNRAKTQFSSLINN